MVRITARAHRQMLGDPPHRHRRLRLQAPPPSPRAPRLNAPHPSAHSSASAFSTLNLRAMTGQWLRPLYVSISRTDPLPLPPRRTVLGDTPLAQQPIHPQLGRTFRGREQVRRPTAPGKTLQGNGVRKRLSNLTQSRLPHERMMVCLGWGRNRG